MTSERKAPTTPHPALHLPPSSALSCSTTFSRLSPPSPPPSPSAFSRVPPPHLRRHTRASQVLREDDDRQLAWTAEMIAKEELYKANVHTNSAGRLTVEMVDWMRSNLQVLTRVTYLWLCLAV